MRVLLYFERAHPGQNPIARLCLLLTAVVEALHEPILAASRGFRP